MIDIRDLISKEDLEQLEGEAKSYMPDYKPPKKLEEIILANNAYLKVILENQAELYAMLHEVTATVATNASYDRHPDNHKAAEAAIQAKKDDREMMAATKKAMDQMRIHKEYLEVTLDKMKEQ